MDAVPEMLIEITVVVNRHREHSSHNTFFGGGQGGRRCIIIQGACQGNDFFLFGRTDSLLIVKRFVYSTHTDIGNPGDLLKRDFFSHIFRSPILDLPSAFAGIRKV